VEDILHNLSAPALAAAIDESNAAYWLHRARLANWEIAEEHGVTWYRSGRRGLMTNGVTHTMLAAENADAVIARTLAHFTRLNLPCAWFDGPAHHPTDLGRRLEAHGLQLYASEPGMAIDLERMRDDLSIPNGLSVERIHGTETLAAWLSTYRLGEDVPLDAPPILMESCVPRHFGEDEPLRLFLARLDGEPVATAQVLLAAGVAGIYGVAVLPAARRRGIGAAVTRAALQHARELGYRVGVLHATELGYGVYRRLGFAEYCTFNLYAWRPN
jgi:Acetyltransferase (GNAT) family